MLTASHWKPKPEEYWSVYHKICVPQHMFIPMFCRNGSGGIYWHYFHNRLSTAELAGLWCSVMPSGNCSNCKKRKCQAMYLWSKPQHSLLSDGIRCLRHLWTQNNWYGIPPESTRLSQLLQEQRVSVSLHHGVLWAAHSVGLKLTCISGPICQKGGGGGVGSKFSGLVWGKKTCQLHRDVGSRSTGL